MKSKLEREADINLLPGELYLSEKPLLIKTLLGSCLSIVFYNKRKKIAAISHAQLPGSSTQMPCGDNCPLKCNAQMPRANNFKYVRCVVRYMLEQFSILGISKNEIDVKMFGGAAMMSSSLYKDSVGKQNIEAAREEIKENKLNLTREDTGGRQGRTIYLFTDSGDVLVKKHAERNK